jgi:DNA polymerase III delta prime subunit
MVNAIPAVEAESHPDVRKLEPESKSRRILVEPFQEFCGFFFSTSFKQGAIKTGIIFDADRLHLNAANAFLKTLEEPPANTLFILVTANPGLLPATILSVRAFPRASDGDDRSRCGLHGDRRGHRRSSGRSARARRRRGFALGPATAVRAA